MAVDPPANGYQLVAAFDRLRDDFREDLDAMERRVTVSIESAVRQVTQYQEAHGQEHAAGRLDAQAAHARFDAFIQASTVSQARRDGALGVLRFVGDVAGRNWKAILILMAALLTFAGNLQIDLGVK